MRVYPSSPAPRLSFDVGASWQTMITDMRGGREFRRSLAVRERRSVSVQYPTLKSADIQILWNFYRACRGAGETFLFVFPSDADEEGLYIGKGDGATTAFGLPAKSRTALTVFLNGVSTAAYTITPVADDLDTITFDTAPAADTLITCDVVGKMAMHARFRDDKVSKTVFPGYLAGMGLSIIEVL